MSFDARADGSPAAKLRAIPIGLSIHADERNDLDALRTNGWQLVDPIEACGTPNAYQEFIRGSRAEFGVAKSGYVKSRCGWFSDRSLCYLASGRPVVAQETGYCDFIATGEGLLPFTNVQEAADAVAAILRDYDVHARAARRIAETHFDSDRVLPALLNKLGLTSSESSAQAAQPEVAR